jgi:hypothetical protein
MALVAASLFNMVRATKDSRSSKQAAGWSTDALKAIVNSATR